MSNVKKRHKLFYGTNISCVSLHLTMQQVYRCLLFQEEEAKGGEGRCDGLKEQEVHLFNVRKGLQQSLEP